MSHHARLEKRRRYSPLPSGEELADIESVVTDCCAVPLGNITPGCCHVPSMEEILEPNDTEVRSGTITLRTVFDKPSSTPLAVRTTPVRRGEEKRRVDSYTGLCVSLSNGKTAPGFYGGVRNGLMSVGQMSVVSSQESGSSREVANCPNCCIRSVQQQSPARKLPLLRRSRSNTW